MKHKTTLYWACRAMVPDFGYEPVDKDGKRYGFVACQPEVREKVCAKLRRDFIQASLKDLGKLPIWC